MFPILISIPRLRLGDYWVNEWVKCSKVLLFTSLHADITSLN